MKRRLLQCLFIPLLLIPTAVYADTTQTFIDHNGLTSTPTTVTCSIDSTYSVTVPKEMNLRVDGSSNYTVLVQGDVTSNTKIKVEPKDAVDSVEGINFILHEALGVKDDIVVTVNQDKQEFTCDEIISGLTTTGAISCSGLSAGTWEGIIKFDIAAESESVLQPGMSSAGLYDNSGNLIKSWDELLSEGIIEVYDDGGVWASDEHDASELSGRLVLSESVLKIGSSAFEAKSEITELYIPASVTSIADEGIVSCTNLQRIVVDDGNTAYDSRNDCNAIIETASNKLITGCTGTSIPNGVTSIAPGAFHGMYNKETISIPQSVQSIGEAAFRCSNIQRIEVPNSISVIPNNSFAYCSSLTSVTIPDTVTSIGSQAFLECTGLNNLTIPSTVTTIKSRAFSGCTSLSNINVPTSVTTIGNNAFYNVPHVTYNGSATGSPWGATTIN